MKPGICFCGVTMTQLGKREWMCKNPDCEFFGFEQISICYRPAKQQQQQEPEAA